MMKRLVLVTLVVFAALAAQADTYPPSVLEHEIATAEDDISRPVWFTDFGSTSTSQGQFVASAVASGTLPSGQMPVLSSRPGTVAFRSSSSANSGYRSQTTVTALQLGGGEVYEIEFALKTTTNAKYKIGFADSVNEDDPTDGVYVSIDSSGVATGMTSTSDTRSSTATTYTLAADTWYRLRIEVMPLLVGATYKIWTGGQGTAGTPLWSEALATNLPGAGRTTGAGIVATESAGASQYLISIDWQAVWWREIRGRANGT